MTYERAAEILDPEHRETYESLEIVNEACRMGRAALFRRMPEPPHPDGDESILACPTCGSGEYLYNEDGNRCCFCGWCGQAIAMDIERYGDCKVVSVVSDRGREEQMKMEGAKL